MTWAKTISTVLLLIPAHVWGTTVGLTLKDVLKETLSHNLDIKISNIVPQSSEGAQMSALGEYDFNTSLKYSYDHSDTPSSSSNQGVTSSVVNDTKTYAPTISKKLTTGTELSLPYDYKVVTSNSSSTTLTVGHSTSLGLTLKQPLTKSFYPWYFSKLLTAAAIDVEIAKLKNRTDVIDIVSKTLELYFDTLKEKESLRIKELSLEQSQQTLDYSKNKRKLGKASLVDQLQAEGKFQKSNEGLIEAKNSYQNKADELGLSVYAQPNAAIKINDDITSLEVAPAPLNEEEIITQTLKDRLEIKSSDQSIEKASEENRAAQVDRLPNVTMDGSLTYKGLGPDFQSSQTQVNKGNEPSYSATLNLEQPVMRYAAKGQSQIKSLRLQQESLRRSSTERNIALEIRKNIRQVQTNWLRIEALRKVVTAEQEKYRGQNKRFKEGAISIFDLTQALQDREQAEFELLSARISYIKSRFQLSKSRGKLLEDLELN